MAVSHQDLFAGFLWFYGLACYWVGWITNEQLRMAETLRSWGRKVELAVDKVVYG